MSSMTLPYLDAIYLIYHRVIILNRGSMFTFQWKEFSPPLNSAHRLLQCYHSQWEIGDAAIPGEIPLSPRHYRAISQWESSLNWRHAVTLYILVGKICISFFLFYCEGMLSLHSIIMTLCHLHIAMWYRYMRFFIRFSFLYFILTCFYSFSLLLTVFPVQ